MEFTLKVSNCLGCHFCPQEALGKAYKGESTLSLHRFAEMLNKLPNDVEIHFSGFSEPFLNQHACDMISEALIAGRQVHVYSTLMGMKEGCVDVLSHFKPHYFRVHVPDKKGLVIPDSLWEHQHILFRRTGIKASYMAMGELTHEIKAHLAAYDIGVDMPDMLSRGGNLWKPKVGGKFVGCSMNRWHSNVVLPDGEVYGCCHDYSLTVPLGNLIKEKYESIFIRGEEWKMNMERDASGTICAQCEWATYR